MTNPRTVQPLVSTVSPDVTPAPAPLISMQGWSNCAWQSTSRSRMMIFCVKPSMLTASVINGSWLDGAMVLMPDPMLNMMVSVPAVALAVWIAARSVHCNPLKKLSMSQRPVPPLKSAWSPSTLTMIVMAGARLTAQPTTIAANARVRKERFNRPSLRNARSSPEREGPGGPSFAASKGWGAR